LMSANNASGDVGKLDNILSALRESTDKTIKYFIGTLVFYLVLIAVFALLILIAEDPKARGADIGILILVSLGFLGEWISPLRGLRGSGVGFAGFLNLFHLPLADRLDELEDEGRWNSPEERLHFAEELLEHQAAAEKEMGAWPNRLLSIVVITAIDLLIWLVWDNWIMALINQVIALVVSQIHINIAPNASLKALESLGNGRA
jgi:hypothetical protein